MRQARPTTWVALSIAVAVTALGGGERAFYASGTLYLILTVLFAAMVWFMTSARGQRFAWPPLVFLGRISYPLYLVHVGLGYPLIRLLTEHGWSTLASTAAACVVSVAMAVILHVAVEIPAGKWLRARLEPRPSEAMVPSRQSFSMSARSGD